MYQQKWLQFLQRMDTNRIIKQVLQHKQKGRETWDVRGNGGRTRFILRVKKQRFDEDPNELLPLLHPANHSVSFFPSAHNALSWKLIIFN